MPDGIDIFRQPQITFLCILSKTLIIIIIIIIIIIKIKIKININIVIIKVIIVIINDNVKTFVLNGLHEFEIRHNRCRCGPRERH